MGQLPYSLSVARWAGGPESGGACLSRRGSGPATLTLLDVFRRGTSFSELILASRSSHARPVF